MSPSAEIRQRLSLLSPRERIMAAGAGIVVLAYAGYLLLWQPLQQQQQQLQQSLKVKSETYQYLQQMAGRVTALGSVNAPVEAVEPGRLPSILKQSASQMQLDAALRQVTEQSPGQFEIVVEKASFDLLLQWLAALAEQHGARVSRLELTAADQHAGAVDGRLTLVF